MTIYGIVPRPDGSLSLSYTIDGGSAFTISHKLVGNATDTLNYPMIQTGPLAAGNHTIVVTLTDIIPDQKFIVDYITYVPSFRNLGAMPRIKSPSESLINSTSSSNPSSPSVSGSPPSNSFSASASPLSDTSTLGTSDSPSSNNYSVSASNASSPGASHTSSSNNSQFPL
jgi:hypothetical protein